MTSADVNRLANHIADVIARRLAGRGSLEGLSLRLGGQFVSTRNSDGTITTIHDSFDLGTFDLYSSVDDDGQSILSGDAASLSNTTSPTISPAHQGITEAHECNTATSTPNPATPDLISTSSYGPTRDPSLSTELPDESPPPSKRRKVISGLRLKPALPAVAYNSDAEDSAGSGRHMRSDVARLPTRKPKSHEDAPKLAKGSMDNLVKSVWQQIHSSLTWDLSVVAAQFRTPSTAAPTMIDNGQSMNISTSSSLVLRPYFSRMNALCKKMSQASRSARALETIVNARWVECYDDEVLAVTQSRQDLSPTKARMLVLKEACVDFGWTEKELRNKLAIWRGYKELKDAGGWVVLVFAGMGLYRYCKYRTDFSPPTLRRLGKMRTRFEVAADTIHPQWRAMLAVVGQASVTTYIGHPHDWVILADNSAAPLARSYLQWDTDFSYVHLDESIIDTDVWGLLDPRRVMDDDDFASEVNPICAVCHEVQSDDIDKNACSCYLNLFGGVRGYVPVQIMRTTNGKHNGLFACLPFERGTAIGEFVGRVTRNLESVDVMEGTGPYGRYQIWQGREGNHTRFVNHSCRPNSQFQHFVWKGIQRTLLVSKGIAAGQEVTVDYSNRYWQNLEKECLCGADCCRFRGRQRG